MIRKETREREVQPSDFDRTENYFPKRLGAYIIDTIPPFFVLLVLYVALGVDSLNVTIALSFALLLGVLTIFYKSFFEMGRRETPGKSILGLRIELLEKEVPTEAYFMRNLSSIVPFVLPALDMAYGYMSYEDNRQKLLDMSNRMIVVEVLPVVVQEIVRRPMKVEPRPEPERYRLGFDEGYARGNCPRCGAPYRVLPPGNTSFSGLWNHRCTWCNSLITESML